MKEKFVLPNELLAEFIASVGVSNVLTDPTACQPYCSDTSRYHQLPLAVVFVQTHEQVQQIVKNCYNYAIPLTVRGAGSGTPGGAVPVKNGIVLSLEKMNQIINIDPNNRYIKVQAGITNQAVQDAAAKKGFFWAPDPGSAAYCTVGGNLAYNAAGPRAVKYGTCRENVLGLRAVIGTGESITIGTCTTKGAVGYDLTRLLIGSEGTLAVITEATLKLLPIPPAKATLRLVYQDISSATSAVTRIMSQSYTPCALELLDFESLKLLKLYGGIEMPARAGALLLVDFDGAAIEMAAAMQAIKAAAQHERLLEVQHTDDLLQREKLWEARRNLSLALRHLGLKKINEDVVVPVSNIPQLFAYLAELANQEQILIINFGHAGNGNIHVNLMIDMKHPEQSQLIDKYLEKIFTKVIELNGTLSGEHGIGIEKRHFLPQAIDPVAIQLMKNIKSQFDPKNILNPDKIFPIQ